MRRTADGLSPVSAAEANQILSLLVSSRWFGRSDLRRTVSTRVNRAADATRFEARRARLWQRHGEKRRHGCEERRGKLSTKTRVDQRHEGERRRSRKEGNKGQKTTRCPTANGAVLHAYPGSRTIQSQYRCCCRRARGVRLP